MVYVLYALSCESDNHHNIWWCYYRALLIHCINSKILVRVFSDALEELHTVDVKNDVLTNQDKVFQREYCRKYKKTRKIERTSACRVT